MAKRIELTVKDCFSCPANQLAGVKNMTMFCTLSVPPRDIIQFKAQLPLPRPEPPSWCPLPDAEEKDET